MNSSSELISIELCIENQTTVHLINPIYDRVLSIMESLIKPNIVGELTEIQQVVINGNEDVFGSYGIWQLIMAWVLQRQAGLNRGKPPFHTSKLRTLEPIGIYFDSIFDLCKAFVNYAPDLNITVQIEGEDYFELAKAICLELATDFFGSISYQEHISNNSIALFKSYNSKTKIATAMLAELNELNKGKNPYSPQLKNFHTLIEFFLFIKRCRHSTKLAKKQIDKAWENYKDAYLDLAKKLPKENRLVVFWEEGNRLYEGKGGRRTKLIYDPKAVTLKISRKNKNAKSARTV